VIPAPRPTTILPDGTPLYPVEWSPPVDKPSDKPARPRFPGGGLGAREGTTVPTATTQRQGRVAAKRTLDGVVSWAGGSPQAPPPRVPESAKQAELPAILSPRCHGFTASPRNVGQYSTPPPTDGEDGKRPRRFDRLRMARKVLKGTPMGLCMRYARDSGAGVQTVMYGGTAGYRGWQHCGSRLCPWCSAVLAQKDTDKAERFIRGWVKRNNAIALCHYTLRHTFEELPQAVWDAQTRVLNSLHSGQPWERFKKRYGLLEHIYGNEVTDGDNGCHKHQHRAWEVQMCGALKGRSGRRSFGRRMEREYEALYMRALAKHGRSALPGIALKVSISAPTMENASKAAEYVTKFAKETQQGGLKSGHKGNHTVFELLDIAGDKTLPEALRRQARARYADLYFGLKGKHWSYFSEATAANEEPVGGEEEVPEVTLDDEGELVHTMTAMQAAMLADQDLQLFWLELVEQKGPSAADAWMKDFSDPVKWSEEWKQRYRT
jgi:hypothetical protein